MNRERRDEGQHEGGFAENAPVGASLNAAKQCETDRHVDRCGADRDADRHGEKPYGTQRSDDAGATPGQCRDDRGTPVQLGEIRRVVSLVPSLTEAIAATCPQLLVGCTDFCVRPPDMDDVVGHAVRRVRGTKNPDRAAIAELRPDLVIANDEENRAFDVEKLRAELAEDADWSAVVDTLDARLRHELGVPVTVAETPLRAVVRGAGRCVDDFAALQPVLVDGHRF